MGVRKGGGEKLKKKKCYICFRKSLHSEEHKKYKLGEDLDHLDVLSD
jgi:hypothetical protein